MQQLFTRLLWANLLIGVVWLLYEGLRGIVAVVGLIRDRQHEEA